MNVLLTGATGFLGSEVARIAISSGASVRCLIRQGADCWRLADVTAGFERIVGALSDFGALAESVRMSPPDLCIHLAWPNVRGDAQADPIHLAALRDSIRLAEILLAGGCRRIVGVGSVFEFGSQRGFFHERYPTAPESLYAASKVALSAILGQLHNPQGMTTAWVRPFHLFGPREDPRRVIPSVIHGLLQGRRVAVTSGNQFVDFLHVADSAAAIWAVASDRSLSGAFNIGSGVPRRLREVLELIGEIIGRPDLIDFGARQSRPEESGFCCADTFRLLQETKWRARYNLPMGLTETIHWWAQRSSGDQVAL